MKNPTNEIDDIAFCGLYCGECVMHVGKVADLARDLRKECRSSRMDKTAEALSDMSFFRAFEDYPKCYEVLGAMVKLRCNRKCRGRGGNPYCAVRKCCERKQLLGCWECGDFEECGKLDFLRKNHGNAHLKNLKTLKKKGINGFLKGKKYWYTEAKV